MLIIPIVPGNLGLIKALNGGVSPLMEEVQTYLVVEAGEVNRIINYFELAELRRKREVQTVTRKIHYVL